MKEGSDFSAAVQQLQEAMRKLRSLSGDAVEFLRSWLDGEGPAGEVALEVIEAIVAAPDSVVESASMIDAHRRLIPRYQRNVRRLLNMFQSDPLPPTHPAHFLHERLEALIDLGLVGPTNELPEAIREFREAALRHRLDGGRLCHCDGCREKQEAALEALVTAPASAVAAAAVLVPASATDAQVLLDLQRDAIKSDLCGPLKRAVIIAPIPPGDLEALAKGGHEAAHSETEWHELSEQERRHMKAFAAFVTTNYTAGIAHERRRLAEQTESDLARRLAECEAERAESFVPRSAYDEMSEHAKRVTAQRDALKAALAAQRRAGARAESDLARRLAECEEGRGRLRANYAQSLKTSNETVAELQRQRDAALWQRDESQRKADNSWDAAKAIERDRDDWQRKAEQAEARVAKLLLHLMETVADAMHGAHGGLGLDAAAPEREKPAVRLNMQAMKHDDATRADLARRLAECEKVVADCLAALESAGYGGTPGSLAHKVGVIARRDAAQRAASVKAPAGEETGFITNECVEWEDLTATAVRDLGATRPLADAWRSPPGGALEVALWDAINEVVRASGGNDSHVSDARMDAVVKVNAAVSEIVGCAGVALKKKVAELARSLEFHIKERDALQAKLALMNEEIRDGAWIWADSPEDDLASMSSEMIVRIAAGTLRGMLRPGFRNVEIADTGEQDSICNGCHLPLEEEDSDEGHTWRDCIEALERLMADKDRMTEQAAFEAAAEVAERWAEHYPEDVFPSRVGAMARHTCRMIASEIKKEGRKL